MDEKTLLAKLVELAPAIDPEEALALGEAEWPGIEARPATPEDAESCRLLSLSAATRQDFATAATWRDRARSIGERIPWPELIAALDMATAFKALAIRNDDYPRGRTLDVMVGSPEAVEIMQRLATVATGPDSGIQVSEQSPSRALIRRFVFEKTGSFQVALGQFDEAVESFTQAITAAEALRGELKARAGLALASYGRATQQGDDIGVEAAATQTREIAERARDAGQLDVAEAAFHNTEVMGRRGADLRLYEIL